MGYSEALEQQVAALKFMESRAGNEWIEALNEAGRRYDSVGEPWDQETLRFYVTDPLKHAEPFYWATAPSMLLSNAVAHFPDTAFRRDMAPVPAGYCWFQHSIPIPGLPDSPIRALTWHVSWGGQDDSRHYRIAVTPFVEDGARYGGRPTGGVYWREGATWRDELQGLEDTSYLAFLYCLTGAMFNFLNQQILVAQFHRVDRHAVKRLEREGWTHEPLVRVVELRRKASQARPSDDPKTVAWTHQWVVSGHWRQQPYPSLGIVQPRWIMPFVKGPTDRPLKPPRAKVFAVVR